MTVTSSREMEVQVERKPGSEVTISVVAPASEVDRAAEEAVRRFAQRMRIPGFRPGKAPVTIVERQLGWPTIRQETIETLVPELYIDAMEREGIQPVGDPKYDVDVETVERGSELRFTATVTVRPEVDLGDYTALRVEPVSDEVTDKDIDDTIQGLRERHSVVSDVERGAQLGDVVNCTLEMKDGETVVGGTDGEERDLDVDPTRLIPGLPENLVNMSAGEEKDFKLTLPEDFSREELRGKEVDVHAKVLVVRERVLPEFDDALAELDGHGPTADDLREFYVNQLRQVAEREAKEKYEEAVLTAFRNSLNIDVPDLLIEAEIDSQIRELEYRFESMGLPFHQYLAAAKQSLVEIRAEKREAAVQRVRLELGLDTLANKEQIELDESAVVAEEKRAAAGRKLTAGQRRTLHRMAHTDLRRQAAAARLMEIARGEG